MQIEKTDLDGVKFVAKQFLVIDIHAFTSSPIMVIPAKGEYRILDITKSEDLTVWRSHMNELIDNAKSADEIYMMVNKPYVLIFLKFSENYLSQDDFSQILGDAWTRAENTKSLPYSRRLPIQRMVSNTIILWMLTAKRPLMTISLSARHFLCMTRV